MYPIERKMDEDDLKSRIKDSFEKRSCSLTFAKSWIPRFMNKSIKILVINYNIYNLKYKNNILKIIPIYHFFINSSILVV